MKKTGTGRQREGRKGGNEGTCQPKSVTLGEVSRERDLEQREAKSAGEENICNALWTRARAGLPARCLLLYAAISGRNGGMSNEGGTRSS